MSAPTKPAAPPPNPLGDSCRTDYRALEPRDTLGQWDLQYTHGPKMGQHFRAVVKIVNVQRYAPKVARKGDRGNKLLLTLEGKNGVLAKKWAVGPDTKKSIAEAVGSYVIQDWWDKMIAIYVDTSIMFGKRRVGGLRAARADGKPLTEETLDAPVDEAKAAELDSVASSLGLDGDA